jgi:predicted RNA binding protein YcfA (HicA-like mRNA interferase family)
MSKLPQISGKDCIKALAKAGFYIKRQKGSHIILCRNQPFTEVVVPNHKTLDKGTLRAIIRQVELDVDEFIQLLND